MGSPSSVETSVRSLARRRGGGRHLRRQVALPPIVNRLGQHPRQFPAAHENPSSFSAATKSSRHWALRWSASTSVSCASEAPLFFAALTASSRPVSAAANHWVRSPLTNTGRACQVCHPYSDSEIQARVAAIQDRRQQLLTDLTPASFVRPSSSADDNADLE